MSGFSAGRPKRSEIRGTGREPGPRPRRSRSSRPRAPRCPGYTSEPPLISIQKRVRSRNRSSTSWSVWTRWPWKRRSRQPPASSRLISRTVRAPTGPAPSVVRSRVKSWMTTGLAVPRQVDVERDGRRPPASRASSKAAMVCSGASAEAPRSAMTSGIARRGIIVSLTRCRGSIEPCDARPRRGPPGRLARSPTLLPDPLRGDSSTSPLDGPLLIVAEPRHLCRPRARVHSGAPARPLHGMERALPAFPGSPWLIRRLRAFPVELESADPRATREAVRLLQCGRRRHDLSRGRPQPRRSAGSASSRAPFASLARSACPCCPSPSSAATSPGRRAALLPRPGRLTIIYHPVIVPPADGDVKAAARRIGRRRSHGSSPPALPAHQQPGRAEAVAGLARSLTARRPRLPVPARPVYSLPRWPRRLASAILVLHGPNLNLLGTREPAVYGRDVARRGEPRRSQRHAGVARGVGPSAGSRTTRASSWTGSSRRPREGFAAIVINPGALTHYSVALRDAVAVGDASRSSRCTSRTSTAGRSSATIR